MYPAGETQQSRADRQEHIAADAHEQRLTRRDRAEVAGYDPSADDRLPPAAHLRIDGDPLTVLAAEVEAIRSRCGRLDKHPPHEWTRPRLINNPAKTYTCSGSTVTEGGQLCAHCQRPAATCWCKAELEVERNREWYS